jgi:hypothetical protein
MLQETALRTTWCSAIFWTFLIATYRKIFLSLKKKQTQQTSRYKDSGCRKFTTERRNTIAFSVTSSSDVFVREASSGNESKKNGYVLDEKLVQRGK